VVFVFLRSVSPCGMCECTLRRSGAIQDKVLRVFSVYLYATDNWGDGGVRHFLGARYLSWHCVMLGVSCSVQLCSTHSGPRGLHWLSYRGLMKSTRNLPPILW